MNYRESVQIMFDRIREDYDTHGRELRNRAFWAMILYRFGQWSLRLRFAPARWLTGKIYGTLHIFWPILSGVMIDRRMKVGRRLHIVHPGMVVFHPNAIVGDHVGVMHGVTLGQNMNSGVPTIGNRVFIGAGAKILGPVKVGDDSRIAANSLVISDVPPNSLAIGVPAKCYPLSAVLAPKPAQAVA